MGLLYVFLPSHRISYIQELLSLIRIGASKSRTAYCHLVQNKNILLSCIDKKKIFLPKSRKYTAGKLEDGAVENIRN